MTLDDWLAANCRYLDAAVQDLPAKGDLPPFFAAMKDGMPLVVGLDFPRLDKALAISLFQAVLRRAEADQYAIIVAAWYVKVRRDQNFGATFRQLDREGTGGAYKDQRRECYHVVVGDCERSLAALYDVERDYKGKIRRLIRQPGIMPDHIGRMVDLLVPQTRH
jgi:hypothetical protein